EFAMVIAANANAEIPASFLNLLMLLIGFSPFVFLLKFIVTLIKTGKTKWFSQENGQNNRFSRDGFDRFASS
ncbi:MAG: hypothetical protein KAG87_11730, partial [Marinobacter adhaerens]|nr:hypothetical protein [Marinobacter adhaerens]